MISFQYLDFYFKIIDKFTCFIGNDTSKYSNAPIIGSSYSGPAVIPSIAIEEATGRRYKVVSIQNYAFRECSKLKFVTLPDTLKETGYDAFHSTLVESLFIPKSVESINDYAFSNMLKVQSLVFEPGIKLRKIGTKVFHCDDLLTKLVLSQ